MNMNDNKKNIIKRRDVTIFFRDGTSKKLENVYTSTVTEGILAVSLGPINGKITEMAYPLGTIMRFEANAYYDEVPINVHAQ